MRYVGQSYEVTTPVPSGTLDDGAVAGIADAFHGVHEREYGVSSDTFAVAFVTLRVTGLGRTEKPDSGELEAALRSGVARNGDGSLKERRPVYFDGRHHDVDVHDARLLRPDEQIAGPAIIEQQDGVIVLPPGSTARADRYENVLITSEEESA
jgi:N-methylhydantoinase A